MNKSERNGQDKESETKGTVLTRVEAQRSPLQQSVVLANIPDVEIYKDRNGGESCHSQPGQHEDVSQHDELKISTENQITILKRI